MKIQNTVQVGRHYVCKHTRKGTFKMRVTAVRDEWIDGVITDGTAGAIMAYNEREKGEEITVRDSLCTMTEFQPDQKPALN